MSIMDPNLNFILTQELTIILYRSDSANNNESIRQIIK